jgi:hypothetical protein
VFKERERERENRMGETITANLWFCGWRAGERLQKRGVAGKNKKRKKREREREREKDVTGVLPSRSPKRRQKSTYFV